MLVEVEYQVLQLDWQEQYSAVKGFDITDDVSSALLLQQFVSHPQAVDIRTERYCVLVDTRISALHRDVVADQWDTKNIQRQNYMTSTIYNHYDKQK